MQVSQEKQPAQNKNLSPETNLIEVERVINTPVDQLFNAFSNSEAIDAWWWPEGLFCDTAEIDFVEGGRYFINMKGHDLSLGGMTGRYEEIVTNKLIRMTDQFANEHGQPISAQEANIPGEWPETVHIVFAFDDLGKNKSRVKLTQEGIPPEAQKDCILGWNQMFDKLERFLKSNIS